VVIEQLRLAIDQPDIYRYGHTCQMGVVFVQLPSVYRPVTIEIRDTSGNLLETYDGAMPTIDITNPKITGDVIITIRTDYQGYNYERTLNVHFDEITLKVDEPGYYEYGHTVHLGVSFIQLPDVTCSVTIQIKDITGKLLEEYTGNMPSIELTEPKALGDATITIRTEYQGMTYEKILSVYFTGYPVATSVHTKSYVQYEMDNIEFSVEVMDVNGNVLTPKSLSNIYPVCSLSMGTVISSDYVHLGEGEY
ncbi:unnamed protein product, partial [marine sediment metagenome]